MSVAYRFNTFFISVAGWYTSSLSLSVYNKWLFSKDHHNFPYPLFTTMFHNIMLFLLSFLSLHYIVPHLKPTRYPSTYDYFTKVFPCGLATGLDIGLSNSSLKVSPVWSFADYKGMGQVGMWRLIRCVFNLDFLILLFSHSLSLSRSHLHSTQWLNPEHPYLYCCLPFSSSWRNHQFPWLVWFW